MGQVGESTVLDSPTKKKHDNFIMEKKIAPQWETKSIDIKTDTPLLSLAYMTSKY